MKNKLLFFPAAFMLITSLSLAQPEEREDRKENLEAMKIGFFTKRLDLTPDEAKTFWPVYNQFQNELDVLRKSRRGEKKEAKDEFANTPDKDVEKVVDGEIVFRQNELDIMKKYHAQFKQVLPIRKVATLYRTEEDFKRELLNRLQDHKKEISEQPKGPRK